jgi:isocitrate lyase
MHVCRDAAGLNDNDMLSYIENLGRLGFVWQFITLGGLHANALATGKNRCIIYGAKKHIYSHVCKKL